MIAALNYKDFKNLQLLILADFFALIEEGHKSCIAHQGTLRGGGEEGKDVLRYLRKSTSQGPVANLQKVQN